MGTEVIWGDVAGKAATANTDEAGEGLRGVHPRPDRAGDASVRAAKENGGITEVTTIDHSARNFFGIVGEWCTLVRGN